MYTLSPSGSELEELMSDPKMEKLMEDLEFIDKPLAPKRNKKANNE